MINKFIKLGKLKVLLRYEELAVDILNHIINYISEVSSRTNSDKLVNVYIFNRALDMEEFLELKGFRLGVSVIPKGLLSYHEAWEGIPVVYLSRETYNKYGDAMFRALVHHELSHALLHGEITYYELPADIDYHDLTIVESYVLFSGVKDYEVSSFLKKIGLGTYQRALIKYHLQEIEFNETLIKTVLFLLPLTEIFSHIDAEVKRIFKLFNMNSYAITYLKESLMKASNTFDRLRKAINWYLNWWPRSFRQ